MSEVFGLGFKSISSKLQSKLTLKWSRDEKGAVQIQVHLPFS